LLALCLLFALWTALTPIARSCFRVDLDYNEGWNVYNAALAAAHQPLYPAKYAWTTNNYPMLSYCVAAQLQRVTHDFLFTGRALSLLSLIGCCVLVAAIARRMGVSGRAASLAGIFSLAVFCIAGEYPIFIGMDDPQLFALFVFMLGLWVYLASRKSTAGVVCAALIFVVAGCIKHSPLEFPLAVLLDLLLLNWRRSLWFALSGALFAGAAVLLQIHYGGPFFVEELLMPRGYSWLKAAKEVGIMFGPLLLPLCAAVYAGVRSLRNGKTRIAGFLLLLSLLIGGYFRGGIGVSINAQFSALLAMSILVGIFLDAGPALRVGRWRLQAGLIALLLFAWLLIPWVLVPSLDERGSAADNLNPMLAVRNSQAAEARFDQESALLRSHSGPALCENLLLCYFAGKPYRYDPFNAKRLVDLGKLDAQVQVSALQRHEYSAVQLSAPLDGDSQAERFAPAILDAIKQNYRPVLCNQDGAIYLPR
jgi:hypothetical protein